eukprot:500605-Pelagomonas_calceolata.AAC.5
MTPLQAPCASLGASTDARVSVEMMGPYDDSTSGPIRLAIPDSHHPSFGRNALDIFLVGPLLFAG